MIIFLALFCETYTGSQYAKIDAKKNFILLEPEGENVDVLNQGGVGGGLLNICDKKVGEMIRTWDVKFVVGEVLAGHLAKSYKVGREAFFSPIIKLMLLLAETVSSAIL